MEIGALLRKSLPFLGQLQNQPEVGRVEEEGGRANPAVHPADRLTRVARVEQELFSVLVSDFDSVLVAGFDSGLLSLFPLELDAEPLLEAAEFLPAPL